MIRSHQALAFVAAAFGVAAPLARSGGAVGTSELAAEIEAQRDHLSALELAARLLRADPSLLVFDLRSAADFEELHVPTAQLASLDSLMRENLTRDATLVLYSEGGAHAAQAWVLLRLRGYRNVFVLREGMYEWISRIRDPRLAIDATPAERLEFERAAVYSRFFGGTPVEGVPRSEVPVGYWSSTTQPTSAPAASASRPLRRRGC